MSKLYQFKEGIIGEDYDGYSLINRGRWALSYSSYRGGTTEYLNEIVIKLFSLKLRHTWFSEEHHAELKESGNDQSS